MPEMLTLEDISEVKRRWQWYSTKIRENYQTVELEKYLTKPVDSAINFIDQHKETDAPFMLFLAYNALHLSRLEKYLDRFPHIDDFRRKHVCAMISAVDDGVGRILEKLETEKITEDTIIFFQIMGAQ